MHGCKVVIGCALWLASAAWYDPAWAQVGGADPAARSPRDAHDAAITVRVGREVAIAAPAADHVEISTRNGIVTLAGRVDSERMRQRVVALAFATRGVAGVNDQLVIVPKRPEPTGAPRQPPR